MKNYSIFLYSLLTTTLLSCSLFAPKITFEALTEEEQHKAENALAGMELYEGLEATVFASEPTLINPTNIDIDEKGRVWVIEALNYRNSLNPDNPYRDEGDRILILEDTDSDGKSDKTKVFYQGEDINSALGIWVMGNKVIVSSSPNIFLFTDEDGDDKPDKKETWFTNIKGWDHDHGAHAFIFGPDGRLYFNMGNEGIQLQNSDSVTVVDVNGKPIITDGTNFRQGLALRCEVDGSAVEVLAHNFRNNYELAVDSYGSIWQSDNDDDGNKGTRINYVMEYGNYGFTDAVTGAGWRARRVGRHEEIPKRHWHLNDPGVVPNLLQTLSGSPTGILFYEGNLLPEVFHQQMIHCEPGHQVVRAYPTKKSGAGYTAEIVNIMKGKDIWFRPSDVCTAPDGSIFVADWYDPGVGGHKMGDVERGRIYRIAPKGHNYKVPDFDISTPESAIESLQNPNLSIRYLAWNALHNWGEKAEAALQELWSAEAQNMRARALWLLARLEGKTGQNIQQALRDDNPDIRITGLRVARQLDKGNLETYMKILQHDQTPEVRREVAVALRHFPDEDLGADIWTNLAMQYEGTDRWYLEALGIAADTHTEVYFDKWMAEIGDSWNSDRGRDIIWRIHSDKSLAILAQMIADPNISDRDLKRFFRAFHFHKSDRKNDLIAGLIDLDHPKKKEIGAYALGELHAEYVRRSPKLRQSVKEFLPLIEGTPEWLTAVKNLGLIDKKKELFEMFIDHEDQSLAVEAAETIIDGNGGVTFLRNQLNQSTGNSKKDLIRGLGLIRSGEDVQKMLHISLTEGNHDLPTKRLLVESLGNSGHGQRLLYNMLESNELDEELVTTAALKLMYSWDGEIRNAAASYLPNTDEDFEYDLNELADVKGDAVAGKEAFITYCNNCHQVNGEGINYGPDLSEIGSKLARKALYSSIIYPSAGINFGYEGLEISTKDGGKFVGFIESETEGKITLRMLGGLSKSIPQYVIDSRIEMEKSLMLENLHTAIGKEALIDLVEYLTTLKTVEDQSGD